MNPRLHELGLTAVSTFKCGSRDMFMYMYQPPEVWSSLSKFKVHLLLFWREMVCCTVEWDDLNQNEYFLFCCN